MKTTNFAKYISGFLSDFLPNDRGVSKNTISSYCHTFILLIKYIEENEGVKVQKLSLEQINKQMILRFLKWLEDERGNSIATRNNRLAAIHSFYKYLQYESVSNLYESQNVLSISYKRQVSNVPSYLSIEGIKLIFSKPNLHQNRGRRDLALLSLIYDIGARVQEVIDLTPSDLFLNSPPTIKVRGKGNKVRVIPMIDGQVEILKNYLRENKLDALSENKSPLFFNSRKEKLTRAGINYILNKYVNMANKENPILVPSKISCHVLRHSKAMHLLQAGVNLVYIRDILGHSSIQTTQIYARADSKQKRLALEKAYIDIQPEEASKEKGLWENNNGLIEWLKKF